MDADLFRPSIGATAPVRPLYSTTALFVPAFFGGPVAATVIFALNAWRARRLRTDAPLIVAGVLLTLLLPWIVMQWEEGKDVLRFAFRGAGLLAAAVFAWRHRPLYRAQELFGSTPPNGTGMGVLALAAGVAANFAVTFAYLQLEAAA